MAMHPALYKILPPSLKKLVSPPKSVPKKTTSGGIGATASALASKPVQGPVTSKGVFYPKKEPVTSTPSSGGVGATAAEMVKTTGVEEIKVEPVIQDEETVATSLPIGVGASFRSDLLTPVAGTAEYARWKATGDIVSTNAGMTSTDIGYVHGSGLPSPSHSVSAREQKLEDFRERSIERTYEMRFEKKHFIGRDPETGKPIYIQESHPQIEHNYPMHDPDYTSAFTSIAEQQKTLETGLENVDLAKTSLPSVIKNYDMVYGSPKDSKFKVDMDNDGVWDKYTYVPEGTMGPLPPNVRYGPDPNIPDDFVYKTREELLPILKGNISKLEEAIDYESELKKSLSDISNTESLLKGYQRLGYEMDVKGGSYEFHEPSASKVYDWRYGKEGHSVIPKIGAAWKEGLFIPTAFAGAQTLITGDPSAWETKQEELASGGLGFATTIEHKGLLGYGMEWGTSDAMIYGVYIPLGTAGLGYGLTGMGAGLKVAGGKFVAQVGTKLPTVFTGTGGKIITTTMKVGSKVLKPIAGAPSIFGATAGAFGKVMGTKAGEVLFTGSLFGAIEGPRFATIIAERPETFGSEMGKTLLGWGGAIVGFKYGQKLWTIRHPPTKIPPSEEFFGPEKDWTMRFETGQKIMGKQPITMEKIPSTLKDYSEFKIMGDFGKQYVTDIRGPGNIITRGPYDVSLYGKAYVAKHDIITTIHTKFGSTIGTELKIIPKGTTFSFTKGIIRDPITGKLIQTSTGHVFKTIGTGGPLTIAVTGPEATIPNAFWAKGTTRLLSGGEAVKVTGTGLLSTSKTGQTTLSTWGKSKDITTIISKGKGIKVSLSGKETEFTKTGLGKWKPTIDTKIYSADISQYKFYGEYKPVGFDVGEVYQTGSLAIITDTKPISQIIVKPVGKTSLLYSEQAVASLVKPVQPTTITEILSLRQAAGEIVGGVGGAVGAIPAATTPITPVVSTMLAKTGTGFPSATASLISIGDKKGAIFEAKPISVLDTKPVSIPEITPPSILGELQIIEPVTKKDEKIDYKNIYKTDLKIGSELTEELEERLTSGGLITETDARLGERTEEDIDVGMFTASDVDMDMWQGQQQRLGLRSLLELKTVGEMDLISISVVTPTPTIPVPITPTPPIPPPIFGDDEPLMIKKKKKKPKQKTKYRDEPRIAEKAFLADLISVTGTQARYKGKATHPALTEEMWKLGEETGFVRMPTVELLKEKKGKKKKKTMRLI